MIGKGFSRLRRLVRLAGRAIGLAAMCGLPPALATTVQPPNFEQLVGGADYVVHAVVTAVSAEKVPTARGFKIVTRVEFDVREPIVGAVPERLVLQQWGGRLGDEALMVEGVPHFRVGGEEVLFVRNNGRSVCPLVGMMHGRYRVAAEPATGRRYVQRDDGLPLRSIGDVALPHGQIALDDTSRAAAVRVALSPAEFIQQIRAKAAERNRER